MLRLKQLSPTDQVVTLNSRLLFNQKDKVLFPSVKMLLVCLFLVVIVFHLFFNYFGWLIHENHPYNSPPEPLGMSKTMIMKPTATLVNSTHSLISSKPVYTCGGCGATLQVCQEAE
ncbi:hypothetical protein HanXRQr2_Chr02g0056131 [Helianthus annuus]|uniref:Uncharacterized protein n=1 Tax=Helianthus annuus TaxID=4232 RepID=A0A9K3NY92_HELAN|nr:hypothetical protein HanXRQr2_Chr02g0056131 [Helianthus annuus]